MWDKERLREIKKCEDAWSQKNSDAFEKERQTEFKLPSGINIKRIYTPLDLEEIGFDYVKDLGFPGEYPATRGMDPTMYRTKPYTVGQIQGFATPEECNALFKDLLAKGNEAIPLAFDLPSTLGYDADHPKARHDVGQCGISLSSLYDLETAFNGIDLTKIQVTYISNPPIINWLAMHVALAQKRGYDLHELQGNMQNDILKGYLTDGQYIFPPRQSMRLAADVIEYAVRNLPKVCPINVMLYQLNEAGADEVQAVAFTLALAIAYLEAALERGIDIDEIAPKYRFGTSVNHRDFFAEIAKIRVLRRMWAKLIKERYHAKNPRSMSAWVRARSGGIWLNRNDGDLNVARSAIATLALALAGVQSTNPCTRDEPLGIPSSEASLAAIRMAQLVAYETGVGNTVDPLGGSYYLEHLTSEIEQRATKQLEEIENMGGAVAAIESGYISKELARSAFGHQAGIDSGETIVIGVNKFPVDAPDRGDFYRPSSQVVEKRISQIIDFKRNRNKTEIRKALDRVRQAAENKPGPENNLIYPILEAVKVGVTSGEICEIFRQVFGEYKTLTVI